MKIRFENIISLEGFIKADYIDDDTTHFIQFELDEPIKVRDDLIGISLATLCGQKYNDIYMELCLTTDTIKSIEKFTNANLKCKINYSNYLVNKSFGNQTLNFSGGFDSLATLPFLPENSSLVSMDFGGHFKREMSMIELFDSHIVRTNILETNFRKNSWLFMLIGSILYKDYLNTDYNISGGVIGAGFLLNSNFVKNFSTPTLINETKMKSIPYTLALSEIAAIKLALHNYPELMDSSLVSLANPKEEKRYRKQLLLEIEIEKSNSEIKLSNKVAPPSKPHFKFGDNILLDHLSLYTMKYRGYDDALSTLSDIPEEAYKLSQNLTLNFYNKYYTDVLKFIPKPFRNKFINTLDDANIEPFEEIDWKEYRETLKFLSKYHKIK